MTPGVIHPNIQCHPSNDLPPGLSLGGHVFGLLVERTKRYCQTIMNSDVGFTFFVVFLRFSVKTKHVLSLGNTHFFSIIKSGIRAGRLRLSWSDGETTLWLIKPDTCTMSMMRWRFLDRNTASSLYNVHVTKSKFFRVLSAPWFWFFHIYLKLLS